MKSIGRGVALALAVLLVSCGGSSGPGPAQSTGTVVLVYMVGSTLESRDGGQGSGNLKEMMAAGELVDTTVVVQTGGAEKSGTPPVDARAMQPANIDWTHLQRYVVHPTSLEQVQDLGAESRIDPYMNMGSSLAFRDFVDWAVDAYPAGRYLLVLWDHGGGINIGVGLDEITRWILPVAEIGMVLQGTAAHRGTPLELVGFDACLMGTAETAAALARSSRYMVASQDVEPLSGWDYTSFLRYVDRNPSAGGAAIGAEIVRGYVAKQLAAKEEDVTLSVIDLAQAGSVAAAVDDFAANLKPYAGFLGGWREIAKGRARTLDWGTAPFKKGGLDLADLKGLAIHVVEKIVLDVGPDPALESSQEFLLDAIDASVKTNAALGSNARATGLSVYFPSILAGYPTWSYAAHTAMDGYAFFAPRYTRSDIGLLQAYFDFYLDHQSDLMAIVSMTGDPAAPLSAIVQNEFDQVMAGHQVPSCRVIPREGETVETPCFDSFRFPDEVTRLLGRDAWWVDTSPASSWPALVDGAGHAYPVALIPDAYAGKTYGIVNDYLVPVDGRAVVDGVELPVPGDLSVREVIPASGDAATYRITGFREEGDAPGRERPLADGQVFTIRVHATVAGRSDWYRTDRAVTVSGGTLTLAFRPLGAGNLGYFVADLTGEVRRSALVPYTPARQGKAASRELHVIGRDDVRE